jgi:hypothetical protein
MRIRWENALTTSIARSGTGEAHDKASTQLRRLGAAREAGFCTGSLGRMRNASVILYALAITFVIDGALGALAPQHERGLALAHGLVIGIACYMWCRAEAAARGSSPPGRSALWAGVLPIAGIPIYFFRTRPAGRAALGTAKAAGLVVLLFALDAGVAEAVRALRT